MDSNYDFFEKYSSPILIPIIFILVFLILITLFIFSPTSSNTLSESEHCDYLSTYRSLDDMPVICLKYFQITK